VKRVMTDVIFMTDFFFCDIYNTDWMQWHSSLPISNYKGYVYCHRVENSEPFHETLKTKKNYFTYIDMLQNKKFPVYLQKDENILYNNLKSASQERKRKKGINLWETLTSWLLKCHNLFHKSMRRKYLL